MGKFFVRITIIAVSLYMVISYAIAQFCGIDVFSQWYTVLFEAIIVMYSYSEGKYHCKHIKHLALAILLADLLTRLDNFYNFLTISEHNWIPIVLLVLGISASIISAIRHFLRVSRTKKQRTQNEHNYNERDKNVGN